MTHVVAEMTVATEQNLTTIASSSCTVEREVGAGPDRDRLTNGRRSADAFRSCSIAGDWFRTLIIRRTYPFDDPDVHVSGVGAGDRTAPWRLMVVGGGQVVSGCASIFATLGAKVTLVDRGTRLLLPARQQLSATLARALTVGRTGSCSGPVQAVRARCGWADRPRSRTGHAAACLARSRPHSECRRAAAGQGQRRGR